MLTGIVMFYHTKPIRDCTVRYIDMYLPSKSASNIGEKKNYRR